MEAYLSANEPTDTRDWGPRPQFVKESGTLKDSLVLENCTAISACKFPHQSKGGLKEIHNGSSI